MASPEVTDRSRCMDVRRAEEGRVEAAAADEGVPFGRRDRRTGFRVAEVVA